jgi:hypothetical protein
VNPAVLPRITGSNGGEQTSGALLDEEAKLSLDDILVIHLKTQNGFQVTARRT